MLLRFAPCCLLTGLLAASSCHADPPTSTTNLPATVPLLPQLTGTWVPADKPATAVLRIRPDSTGEFAYYRAASHRAGALPDLSHGPTSRKPLRVTYRPRAANGVRCVPNLEVRLFTSDARFDYELRGDTLLEYDKMGLQGRWVRLHPGPSK